ncbi:unnamed protein product [Cylicocyclus nassatus]|uniref:Uncharacterized protein n=1 Tax=Cylicocyclus nassatus TaxID=53992 RepID=A0AA36MEN3_CYLNA|nr:unnamed protein product [Cylicocyclus nassatus]
MKVLLSTLLLLSFAFYTEGFITQHITFDSGHHSHHSYKTSSSHTVHTSFAMEPSETVIKKTYSLQPSSTVVKIGYGGIGGDLGLSHLNIDTGLHLGGLNVISSPIMTLLAGGKGRLGKLIDQLGAHLTVKMPNERSKLDIIQMLLRGP